MDDDYDKLEWIHARDMNRQSSKPVEAPKIDTEVSQIVGKQIFVNDSKLIKLIAKWKKEKEGGEDDPDNFLQDGVKVEEMRMVLNPERYGKS